MPKQNNLSKLANPNTFLSKYIYGANNPIMNSDPSGMSLLSSIFDAFISGGHDFIATFSAGLDNLLKNKTFQTIVVLVAAAFIGPAAAGLVGASGLTAVSISAAIGGLVGGVGFQGLRLGTFEQGFLAGALVGGTSAYLWGDSALYGNANPLVKYVSSEWNTFVRADKFQYFFNINHADTGIFAGWFGGGFGGPTLGGSLLLGGIKALIPEKNDERR